MTTRLLATLGLALTLAATSCGDDKPAAKAQAKASPAQKLFDQAVEASNKDELVRGIELAEQAVKADPDFRDALFLVGVLASSQADEVKDKPAKIANLRKSVRAFADLKARFKTLTPNESTYARRTRLDEARALALEGKPDPALVAIEAALADAFEDTDAIEAEPDFEAVRKLPGFRAAFLRGIKAGVAQTMAGFKPFDFDFNLNDTDDKPFALATTRGKVTIVDIWGTWCPPCRKEIPHFVALLKQYKARGLEIVGINCNEDGPADEVRKTIKDFKLKNEMTYPCVLDDDKTSTRVPKFQGYPTTIFLDRAGKVRLALVGYTSKPWLEEIVTVLLADPARP